jgi:hypothetical protein
VTAAAKTSRDTAAEITFLTRALKAPTLRESADRLAERARAENWTHEARRAAAAIGALEQARTMGYESAVIAAASSNFQAGGDNSYHASIRVMRVRSS